MKLSDKSEQQITDSLKHEGLRLGIGPFIVNLRSRIPDISSRLHLLYPDCVVDDQPGFSDFHISLNTPRGFRKWFRPQVLFHFDYSVPFKPLPLAHAFPLFEWGLNWCVAKYAHQFLIIHSAVLEKNGRAFILPGPPGSGKSTLCAALMLRGWRLLSDEMALIDPETLQITPIPRPVALKNDSIEIIRDFDQKAVIGPPSFDTSKGTVAHLKPTVESLERSQEKVRPFSILFPRYSGGAEMGLNEISKSMTLMDFVRNTFNYNVLRQEAFSTACSLLDQCACYEFMYSDLEEAVNYLTQMAMKQNAYE